MDQDKTSQHIKIDERHHVEKPLLDLVSDAFRALPNVVANRNQIISRVMEIAEKNNDRILYAS
jgi:hypothetical protein